MGGEPDLASRLHGAQRRELWSPPLRLFAASNGVAAPIVCQSTVLLTSSRQRRGEKNNENPRKRTLDRQWPSVLHLQHRQIMYVVLAVKVILRLLGRSIIAILCHLPPPPPSPAAHHDPHSMHLCPRPVACGLSPWLSTSLSSLRLCSCSNPPPPSLTSCALWSGLLTVKMRTQPVLNSRL
jgi:hypothetical protein